MKLLNALILSYIKNAFIGCIGVIIIVSMMRAYYHEYSFIPFVVFNLINLFICFVYSIVFLLPLAYLKKEQIKSNDLIWLFKRYLPWITLVPAACCIAILVNGLGEGNEGELDVFLLAPSVLLCQQAAALWQFLKTIKKQIE